MLERLGHEVWIGNAAEIRASYVRKQKTDKRDAAHILKLLVEQRFPRLWRPSKTDRDLRQLLIHRHRLVAIRARVKNGLQHLMLNRGAQLKQKLWSEAGQKILGEQIEDLDQAVERAAYGNERLADDTTWGWPHHLAGVRDNDG